MRVERPLRLKAAAASAAALAAALAFPAAAGASSGTPGTAAGWVATWAASAMAATPASLAAPDDFSSAGFTDQTIRNIVWTSVGGQAARVRLSNRFGTQPVTFNQVDVGISAGGAAVVPGTNHPVDVRIVPRVRGTIVAFGDSITDGFGSTVNANTRWPNDLARRLLAGPPRQVHPVVDEGISGNRILNNSACLGVNAQARFFRDVAARPGAALSISTRRSETRPARCSCSPPTTVATTSTPTTPATRPWPTP